MLTTILVTAIILLFAGVIYLNNKLKDQIKSVKEDHKDIYNLVKDNEARMDKNSSITFALHGAEVYRNFEKQNLVKKGGKVFIVETDWKGVSKLIPTKEVKQETLPTEETRHTMFEGRRYEYKVASSNSPRGLGAVCAMPNTLKRA